MDKPTLTTEPVTLPAVLTAALVATWNVLVIIFDIDPDLAAAVNIMLGAWVGVLAFWVRSRVSPVRTH